jgi:hypothetical protein
MDWQTSKIFAHVIWEELGCRNKIFLLNSRKINSFNFPLIYALDCPEIFMGEQEERAKLHLKKMENDVKFETCIHF